MNTVRVAPNARFAQVRTSVAIRAAVSVIGQVGNRATNALLTIIVAGSLTVRDFGDFSVIQAILILTTAIGTFGFDVLILRDPSSLGSPHPDRVYYRAKVTIGLLFGVLIAVYTLFTINARVFELSIFAVIAAVLAALAETPETRLAVANSYGARAAVQAIPSILVTIIAILVIRASSLPSTVTLWLACVFLVVREAAHFSTGFLARRRLPRPTPVPVAVRTLVRRSAPFASVGVLGYVYFRIDALILGSIAGPTPLAAYNAEYNLLMGALAVSAALGTLWLRMLVHQPDVWRKLLPGNLLLGIFLAVVFIAGASLMTSIVYGPRYAHAAGLLRVLALVLPLSFCDSLLLRLIYARNRQKLVAPILAVVTVFNVGLNLIFIPEHGAMGAAWVTVATEALLLSSFSVLCWLSRTAVVPAASLSPEMST